MDMVDVLRLAITIKNYLPEEELDSSYLCHEGLSFQCGDYLKIGISGSDLGHNMRFWGKCCKCCMVAADYAIERYNNEKGIVSETQLEEYFGEDLFSRRKECIVLPIKILNEMEIGSNEARRSEE